MVARAISNAFASPPDPSQQPDATSAALPQQQASQEACGAMNADLKKLHGHVQKAHGMTPEQMDGATDQARMGAETTATRPGVGAMVGGFLAAGAAAAVKDVNTVKGGVKAVITGAEVAVGGAKVAAKKVSDAAKKVYENAGSLKSNLASIKRSFFSVGDAGAKFGGGLGRLVAKTGKRMLKNAVGSYFVPVMALIWGYHYICLIYDWIQETIKIFKAPSEIYADNMAEFFDQQFEKKGLTKDSLAKFFRVAMWVSLSKSKSWQERKRAETGRFF